MSLEIEMAQHKCRICLEYCSEIISIYDQVATGVSYLDITSKLTNQLKLDGSSNESLHICVPCATTAKTTYNFEEADYKLEFNEEIIIEEKVKVERIEDENITANCSAFSVKEEIHITTKNEETLETRVEDHKVTVEDALEVYYDKLCDKTLNYRRKLRSHSRVVDKLDTLQCDYCEYTPESLNDYTKHIETEHADKRTKKCNYCDQNFFDTQALKDHLRSHSDTKPIKCLGCGTKFAWKSSLSKHVKRHCSVYGKRNTARSHVASKKCEDKLDQKDWSPYACKICDRRFRLPLSLRRHNKSVHNSYDKSCYFCAFLPKSPDELTKHITQEHADKKPWACKDCGNTYFQLQHLKLHLLTHKGIKGKHMCNVCDYRTHVKSVMVMHMRKHTGEKPFSCSKCSRKFSTFRYLKSHTKSHECVDSDTSDNKNENLGKSIAQKTVDTYVCKTCSNEFAHHSSLRKHSESMHYVQVSCCYCKYIPSSSSDSERHIRKEHSDKKYYACDQCDEVFFSVQNLKTHLLLHSDINNYDCKICNFKCNNKSNLVRHLRKHTGEKPFQCSNCGKAFRVYQRLKVHLANQCSNVPISKVHSANPKDRKHTVNGARNIFACKFCDKTFSFRSCVRQHTRIVHKITDKSCFFCDYAPTSKDDLRKHLEAEHADKKILSCEHCNKTFFDSISLGNHLAVHNTIGNHVCKICGYKFTVESYLIEHMKIHTGEFEKTHGHTFTK